MSDVLHAFTAGSQDLKNDLQSKEQNCLVVLRSIQWDDDKRNKCKWCVATGKKSDTVKGWIKVKSDFQDEFSC
jgi:hypothetical protein